MAVIRSILGDITGSAGGLTFSRQGGKNQLRQKVGKNGSNTLAQAAQRRKFAALGRAARLLREGIKNGFRTRTTNPFMATNAAHVVDDGTAAQVQFAQLELSAGSVGVPDLYDAAFNPAYGYASVFWHDNSDGVAALDEDCMTVALVDPVRSLTVYRYGSKNTGSLQRYSGLVQLGGPQFIGSNPADLVLYAFFRRVRVRENGAGNSEEFDMDCSPTVVATF